MNVLAVSIKLLKNFCVIAGIPLMYGIAGFLMLPVVLKSMIPQVIEQTTGRKASINKIVFNPFSLQFNLRGLSLLELNGKPFVSFDNFYTDLDTWRSIKESALVLDTVLLNKPIVRIAKQKNGQFNFNDLIKDKAEAKKEDETIFPVIIDKVSISEGTLAWENAQADKPVSEDIYPIKLDIENLSTRSDKQFPVRLSVALKSGGKLDWQGAADIQSFTSSGRIKLDKINLKTILQLALPNKPGFDLQGSGFLELEYTAAYAGNALDLAINGSLLKIQGFRFSEKGQDNLNVTIQDTVLAGEYQLNYADNKLQLKADKNKFNANKIQFAGLGNNVHIQDSVLAGNYKFNYSDNKWQFKADKSKLDVKKIQLPGVANSKALIEIPSTVLEAGFEADKADQGINFVLSGEKFDLGNTTLTELGQTEPLVKIPSLNVRGIGFNLASREFSAEVVKAADADFKAWLNPEGKINYLNLMPVTHARDDNHETAAETSTKAASEWKISVHAIALDNFGVSFEDRTLKKPVEFNASSINFKLDNFTNKNGAGLPVQLNAVINKTGSISLAGDTVIKPFSSRLSVNVSKIDLDKFQTYVDKYARIDIIDGDFNVDGNVAIKLPEEAAPDIKFKGNSWISGLATRDKILNRDFINWKKLTLSDIDADLLADRYTARLLKIEKPYARVVIAKDKSVNVNDVIISDKSKSARSAKTKNIRQQDLSKPYFKLDKVQVQNGSSDFADLSLILPFAAQIKSLDGGASGITSEKKSTLKFSLKGNAYDLAPVDISGYLRPYLGDYNVLMNFIGMPMPLVSPYMVQFAGYKVEKGKLTLELRYQVVNGQLTASNKILIDQFELGDKVENPNAVSIPLELAVALLKDSDGKIKLDVPITGSLEDPKFSIGKIITEALLNTITKIVTSPFKAIASLIGSEKNLSVVRFAPGKAVLDITQMTKLGGLVQVLKDRPVLNLEIKGAAFQEQDWPGMKEDALLDQLKAIKAAEINRKNGKKILAEYVELSDQEYKRFLADMFIEKFPLLANRTLFGTPRLAHPEAGDFYEVAKQKLAGMLKPDRHRLNDLAAERAQAIAKYIVQQGGIQNDRVFILDPVIDPERDNKEIVAALSLKTN